MTLFDLVKSGWCGGKEDLVELLHPVRAGVDPQGGPVHQRAQSRLLVKGAQQSGVIVA